MKTRKGYIEGSSMHKHAIKKDQEKLQKESMAKFNIKGLLDPAGILCGGGMGLMGKIGCLFGRNK